MGTIKPVRASLHIQGSTTTMSNFRHSRLVLPNAQRVSGPQSKGVLHKQIHAVTSKDGVLFLLEDNDDVAWLDIGLFGSPESTILYQQAGERKTDRLITFSRKNNLVAVRHTCIDANVEYLIAQVVASMIASCMRRCCDVLRLAHTTSCHGTHKRPFFRQQFYCHDTSGSGPSP